MSRLGALPPAGLQGGEGEGWEGAGVAWEGRRPGGVPLALDEAGWQGQRVLEALARGRDEGTRTPSDHLPSPWPCRITFSLLSEEEQAAAWDGSLGTFQPLLAVQLVNRTWHFLPTDHDPILASGPGVVGLFPQLSAGGPSLTYNSCTQMPCPTGRMTGSFGFKEGDAEAQGTRFIEAAFPTVHLSIPEYIY